MPERNINLIRPQGLFLAMPHKYRAYVAGYRAGKTWAGCSAHCQSAIEFPRVPLAYFAPTYTTIRDVLYPTIERVAFDWGLTCDIKVGNKEVHLFRGREYRTTIICRSMEKPANIIGFEVGNSLVDEIDTLPTIKAEAAWAKIIARSSFKFAGMNRIDVTTTPEGFAFTYNRFAKAVREKPELGEMYGLVQASTYENEANLPDDYIPSLLATYPENLIEAYLNGQFVNLTQGTVYRQYDRKLNRSRETIQENEPLFIGMDFNVGNMSAIVHVKRDGKPHAVDELIGALDTPDMIQKLKERFWKFENGDYKQTHQIRIYPDASGRARKTVGASTTDIALLQDARFTVSAPAANPPVRNRVNSMNGMFCNAQNERRYFVNDDKAPTYAENLEQQAYDANGEPDKKHGKDHTNDAGGYFIHRDYPLIRPVTKLKLGVAM